MDASHRSRGLSLIEVVVLLGVVASLSALSPLVAGAYSTGHVDARTIMRQLTSERSTAVVRGQTSACSGSPVVRSTVLSWPVRGLMFTPDGLPRTCDGGGVGNTTILLEHRGQQAAVIVSSLGRVRWEMR